MAKLPNVRIDDKKTEPIHSRVPYDLVQTLQAEADSFGIKLSSLIHDILTDHVNGEGIHRLPGTHPIETGVRELHHLTLDMTLDGVITPLERQRWTKKMSDLFYKMWNKEHDKQEEIA